MVDLGGYVIILVETNDKRVKLYGSPADKADLEVKDEVSQKGLLWSGTIFLRSPSIR